VVWVCQVGSATALVTFSCDVHLCSLHSAHANLTVNVQLYTLQLRTAGTSKCAKRRRRCSGRRRKTWRCLSRGCSLRSSSSFQSCVARASVAAAAALPMQRRGIKIRIRSRHTGQTLHPIPIRARNTATGRLITRLSRSATRTGARITLTTTTICRTLVRSASMCCNSLSICVLCAIISDSFVNHLFTHYTDHHYDLPHSCTYNRFCVLYGGDARNKGGVSLPLLAIFERITRRSTALVALSYAHVALTIHLCFVLAIRVLCAITTVLVITRTQLESVFYVRFALNFPLTP
jgi:hypothetical protein